MDIPQSAQFSLLDADIVPLSLSDDFSTRPFAMTEDRGQRKNRFPQSSVERLRLDHGATKRDNGRMRSNGVKEEDAIIGIGHSSQSPPTRSASQSPPPQDKASQWPDMDDKNHEEVIGGEITVKQEPGQPPKLSRSTSHKIVPKPTPLFDDYPEKTDEAKGTFELITACSYTSKYIGSTEHDSMDCDCAEEWGKTRFRYLVHPSSLSKH